MSRRGKKPYLCVRMPAEELELLYRVARERGEDASSFTRRAVYAELARLGYLSEEKRKALGLAAGSGSADRGREG